MKITELLQAGKPCLSFEVSPPTSAERYEEITALVDEVAGLHPDFMSVTYGAGGGTNDFTVPVA
ncbi:MAG: methylenetetrahydrofolate reductase, partial [Oscillospiraceae bacterium]|nr:methylenetetrahydrofolate reductase [Oscillospiraceae bacterium]